MIFEFNDCELDLDRVVLRRGGTEVAVEPQVFDVLELLIERRGQVVRKEELLDEIWGDRFVSESALTSRMKSARRAVGDDGSRQAVIRTVHGKGYEFIADVRVCDESATAAPGSDTASRAKVRNELPMSLQRLIGRDELVARLVVDLSENRCITLVGSAGVGKTSIGLELARAVAGNHADGVFVVELVTVTDRDAAYASLARALGVNTGLGSSLEDAIVEMLRGRDALLLLDNCEHLVEPVAELVGRILQSAPRVSILATSREPLAVMGEHVRHIEPFPVDGLEAVAFEDLAAVPAVALFMERAQAADPGFVLTEQIAPSVVEICRRLDGIPLALELAASRAKAIDVAEIASRLDERFRLLKGVRRDADPRHRTLQDAIGWSYELLEDDEKRVFASLAVFAGQFDLAAAESIADGDDDILDVLTRLTERSMLAVRRSSGGTRYEMLETLREYGRSRLEDERSVRLYSAHARQFANLALTVAKHLDTSDEHVGVALADGSFPDLRAAQRFSVEIGDVDTAFVLAASMREYAMRALHYEVFTWADSMTALPGAAEHPLYPVVLGVRAYGAFARGEFDNALELAAAGAAAERDVGVTSSGLIERVRANVFLAIDEIPRALAEIERMVDAAEANDDDSRRAHAYYFSSIAMSSLGEYDEGRRLSELSRRAAQRTGGITDMAEAWVSEGYAIASDDQAALSALAHADRLARSVGNRWMSAFARTEASGLRVSHGELEQGCAELAELVDIWYRAGEWAQQWHTLMRCVIALDRIGRPAVAAEVLGAIEARSALGAPPFKWELRRHLMETRDSLHVQLGASAAADLRASGAELPVVTTVERTREALTAKR